MTDEQRARLPRYAQEHIVRLERRLERLSQKVQELKGDEKTLIRYMTLNEPVDAEENLPSLPSAAEVRFYAPNKRSYIAVRHREQSGVDVSAATARLMVLPRAGNVVYIRTEEWEK